MEFAENGRISHRQLYRQMILTLFAPFLLCLFQYGKIMGIEGLSGTFIAVILLVFYMIFLFRIAPYYGDIWKAAGGFGARIIGVFFLLYVVFTGAFLLSILEEIVPKILVTGVSGRWISLTVILVCSVGTSKGMQKRGRMAEVSGGFLLGGILLMILVCIGQGKVEYVREIFTGSTINGRMIFQSGYEILCGFSALGLMPFLIEDVEKHGNAAKMAILGIVTIGGLLLIMEVLLPAVLGMSRLPVEKYPVLPLLAGADLPGNILARFDILWMGFLLYSMIFSIGSLLHYGHLIIKKTHLGTGKIWMVSLIYLLSIIEFQGIKIEDYFRHYLAYIFVPGLLFIQIFLFQNGRRKWKKHSTLLAVILTICLVLGGCSGSVEPEKRMYPMALGVDFTGEEYTLIYGMPNLAEATGQDKGGGEKSKRALELTGKNFSEIEALYNRSQSKFLDLGHLEVLIIDENMLQNDRWRVFIDYFKEKPFVGEDLYVFLAKDAAEVMKWEGDESASVGEYLTGMMENRMTEQKIKSVTLREVLHERYKSGNLIGLPRVRTQGKNLEIVWE